MPSRKSTFTQEDLLKLAVGSGISTTEIRYLVDEDTARSLGAAVYAEARDHIRGFEVDQDPTPGRGHIVRFHLVDHSEPPPCYKVVEQAARRHLRLEHITAGFQR